MSLAKQVSEREGQILLSFAKDSIARALRGAQRLEPGPDEFPDRLWQEGAAFVTLTLDGELRGCIGHLEARQPLLEDVIENAIYAAFRDPRFAPLTEAEFQELEISISILSPAEPMSFNSEEDLLRQIRPGVDGLILKEGGQQGTFLPSVWESLPEPAAFLRHLKQKAGLSPDYWSDSVQVSRYTTQHISKQ